MYSLLGFARLEINSYLSKKRNILRSGSLWCAKVPSICSWSWRKLLQLRDRIRPFIKHKVHNGKGNFYGMIPGTQLALFFHTMEIVSYMIQLFIKMLV